MCVSVGIEASSNSAGELDIPGRKLLSLSGQQSTSHQLYGHNATAASYLKVTNASLETRLQAYAYTYADTLPT